MDFVALDVETANPDLSSICQIGLVAYKGGQLHKSWQTLVNPEDYFDVVNVGIHGIDEQMVKEAPTFRDVFDTLAAHLAGEIVVSHTGSDRVSTSKAAEKYGVAEIRCTWLDTAKVVRRAWPEFARRGYGLANVAQRLGIDFRQHDAQEDARAAGEILVRAIAHTGRSVQDWLERAVKPIDPSRTSKSTSRTSKSIRIAREPNLDGPLYGEVLVFTGALPMPRREAADFAALAGCEVVPSVKKTTTLLVVGDQDLKKLAGHDKSSKHRKAEELIAKGQQIRILRESDFRCLVELDKLS